MIYDKDNVFTYDEKPDMRSKAIGVVKGVLEKLEAEQE